MMELLASLENSVFGIWVRESGSVWAYPMIITFHSFGLAIVVGLNAAIDLRLLGVAPSLPVAPMESLFPIMWFGFWMNAISGVMLLVGDATTMVSSPIFVLKMTVIGLAAANLIVIRRCAFRPQRWAGGIVPARIKLLATTSLVLWACAITAGRLTAYLGPSAGVKGIH